jgi:hypothetical protein
MTSDEFQSFILKIRAYSKKHGTNDVLVTRINESIIEFSNVLWESKIECTFGEFKVMIEVGYFFYDKKDDLNLFLEQKKVNLVLKLNQTTLLKKNKGLGMKNLISVTFLVGGILTLLLSFFLFYTNSESSGYVYLSRTGNSLMNNKYRINWASSLLIGCGLLLGYFLTKYYDLFKDKKK